MASDSRSPVMAPLISSSPASFAIWISLNPKQKPLHRMGMPKLAGKVAIVTGASKGIGAAIAEELAKDGASVIVNYSSSGAGAEAVVAKIKGAGGAAKAVHADVSKPADAKKLIDATISEFGRVDILVNNAGV